MLDVEPFLRGLSGQASALQVVPGVVAGSTGSGSGDADGSVVGRLLHDGLEVLPVAGGLISIHGAVGDDKRSFVVNVGSERVVEDIDGLLSLHDDCLQVEALHKRVDHRVDGRGDGDYSHSIVVEA